MGGRENIISVVYKIISVKSASVHVTCIKYVRGIAETPKGGSLLRTPSDSVRALKLRGLFALSEDLKAPCSGLQCEQG